MRESWQRRDPMGNKRGSLPGYGVRPADQLSEEELETLNAANLRQRLESALQEDSAVAYNEVSFILGRLSGLAAPDLVPLVLSNIERLYPVAHSVASFFREFIGFPEKERKKIGDRLLYPILRKHGHRAPDYYAVWILSLFHEDADWNHANKLLRIFESSQSHVVRRYAAHALASCGSRAHAVKVWKAIAGAPPLVQLGIAVSAQQLGDDERKYHRQHLKPTDNLVRLALGFELK